MLLLEFRMLNTFWVQSLLNTHFLVFVLGSTPNGPYCWVILCNKTIWKIHELLFSHSWTWDTILTNAKTHLGVLPPLPPPPLPNAIEPRFGYTHAYAHQAHVIASLDLKLDSLNITTTSHQWTPHYTTQNSSYALYNLQYAMTKTP